MNEALTDIAIVKLPYTGSLGRETSKGPEELEKLGLVQFLGEHDCRVVENYTSQLTPSEEKEYGAWHHLGLASRHLGDTVASLIHRGVFVVGLLANCTGLMGMLGGLQRSGPAQDQLQVGLVWIDAHSDFNTPETTLSGMLGGMPVAISTGLCLHRLRAKCGLDPALPMACVTMMGVRNIDPLEKELLDQSEIHFVSSDEVRRLDQKITGEIERLAAVSDIIYVHIDMDVLDPEEVPGHGLTVKNGPTSQELARALHRIFLHSKTAALGIASYPVGRDPDGRSKIAAYNLVAGAVKGMASRGDARPF